MGPNKIPENHQDSRTNIVENIYTTTGVLVELYELTPTMPKIKRRNTTRNTTFERPGMHLIKTLIPNEMLAHGVKENQVFKNDF